MTNRRVTAPRWPHHSEEEACFWEGQLIPGGILISRGRGRQVCKVDELCPAPQGCVGRPPGPVTSSWNWASWGQVSVSLGFLISGNEGLRG